MLNVAANAQDMLGESPFWDAARRALFWVDLRAPALRRLDVASGRVETFAMPELCGAALLCADGAILVAQGARFRRFDPDAGGFLDAPPLVVEPPEAGNRINDSKCDRDGRLWTSAMRDFGAAPTGALFRVRDGVALRRRAPVTVPNALCFSPDGATIYFADTAEGSLLAAPYDRSAGEVGGFRTLVPAGALPGRPDGATVDAQGFIWNARYQGGALARIAPDGRLDRLVELPVSQPTSCAFGGGDLRTLYVTTSRQKMTEAALAREPLAGALLALDVGVAGLPEAPALL